VRPGGTPRARRSHALRSRRRPQCCPLLARCGRAGAMGTTNALHLPVKPSARGRRDGAAHHPIFMIRILLLLALVLGGCATSERSADPEARTARRNLSSLDSDLGLASDRDEVRTIQLYAGQSQTSLPILRLGGGQQLTL